MQIITVSIVGITTLHRKKFNVKANQLLWVNKGSNRLGGLHSNIYIYTCMLCASVFEMDLLEWVIAFLLHMSSFTCFNPKTFHVKFLQFYHALRHDVGGFKLVMLHFIFGHVEAYMYTMWTCLEHSMLHRSFGIYIHRVVIL